MNYSPQVINAFFEEINELIGELEEKIFILEQNPKNEEIINNIYRLIHSIKGETAMMQFTNFSSFSHKVEDILTLIRDKKLEVDKRIIDLLDSTVTDFYNALKIIKIEGNDTYDFNKSLQKVNSIFNETLEANTQNRISDNNNIDKKQILELFKESKLKNLFKIEITLDDIPMKYARAFLIYNNLKDKGEILYSSVDFLNEEDDENYKTFSIYYASNYDENNIYDFIDVADISRINIRKEEKEEFEKNNIKVEKKNLTDFKGEKDKLKSYFIRVDLRKIEKIMDNMGELIMSYNKLQKFKENILPLLNNDNRTIFNDLLDEIKLIIDNTQNSLMNVRMIPIKNLFSKLPRLVNEISRELNKDVTIIFSGEDTEIDKNIIDELKEPLLHIIRNSIDHGIETAEERIKKGKNKKGILKISAHQSGNKIIIDIEDDGRGINIEKIRKKIIEKSILSETEVLRLSKEEVVKYIFTPGFSTKDEISEISGRGVGMDVVKKSIDKLKGSIRIYSKKNKGTKFSIILPITIAITESLIIVVRNFYFAIPLYFVVETVRLKKNEIENLESSLFIRNEDELIPLVDLGDILELDKLTNFTNNEENKKDKIFVVIVLYKDKKVGLIVDKLIGEQYIVMKPLENVVENFKGLTGATVLGDGRVAYILDPNQLLS